MQCKNPKCNSSNVRSVGVNFNQGIRMYECDECNYRFNDDWRPPGVTVYNADIDEEQEKQEQLNSD